MGCWDSYKTFLGRGASLLSISLGNLGYFVARKPIITLVITIILAILLCTGIPVRLEQESSAEKIWVPQSSDAIKNRDYVEENFPSSGNFFQVMFEKEDQSNVLDVEATRKMLQLVEEVLAVTVDFEGETYTYEDLCVLDPLGRCRSAGYSSFWDHQVAVFDENVESEEDLLEAINQDTFPSGQEVTRANVFGVFDVSNGEITAAELVTTRWLLTDLEDAMVDGEKKDMNEISEEWLSEFADKMDELVSSGKYEGYTIYYQHELSVDEALDETITNDIFLIPIVIFLIVGLSTVVLSRRNLVESRGTLAILGALLIILALFASYGLGAYFGIKVTVLSQVLPFILLGIGIDGVFVLVVSLDEVDIQEPHLVGDTPERVRRMMELGAPSITITSLTNMFAFLFGSATRLPAVQWFCWQAAITVAINYILQMTAFIAVLVLGERRRDAGRYDCFCCFTSKQPRHVDAVTAVAVDANGKAAAAAAPPPAPQEEKNSTFAKRAMSYYGHKILPNPIFQVIAIAAFLAYTGVSIYGSTKLGEGLPLGDLAPDDNYLKEFFLRDDESFRQDQTLIAYIYYRGIDHQEPVNQAKILEARDYALSESEFFDKDLSPTINWLTLLTQFAQENEPEALIEEGDYMVVKKDRFYPLLNALLKEPEGQFYADDVVFDGGVISDSRMPMAQTARGEEADAYNRLLAADVKEVMDEINGQIFGDDQAEENYTDVDKKICYIFEYTFMFYEQDAVILGELLTNLGLALLGVFIVTLLLLVHPTAALMVALAVLCVDLFLFGELWIFDLRFNTVSVVNLVMAVGLAADYAVHIVHKFLELEGDSRAERMANTMVEIGQAVIQGGLTTMVSVIPLGFASSQVFRIFFAMLFGTALFGLIMGMIIVPIFLIYLGPAPIHSGEGHHEGHVENGKGKAKDKDAPKEVEVYALPVKEASAKAPVQEQLGETPLEDTQQS